MDRQRLGLWGTFIFAAAAAVGMGVQVYLIGGFIFGETGWLDTHKDLGKLVHLCYILTFLSALVAVWPNWRRATWPFVLAVIGSVQAFLAGGGNVGGDNGALHAFHAALVPLVFVLVLAIGWKAWSLLQTGHDEVATPREPTAGL